MTPPGDAVYCSMCGRVLREEDSGEGMAYMTDCSMTNNAFVDLEGLEVLVGKVFFAPGQDLAWARSHGGFESTRHGDVLWNAKVRSSKFVRPGVGWTWSTSFLYDSLECLVPVMDGRVLGESLRLFAGRDFRSFIREAVEDRLRETVGSWPPRDWAPSTARALIRRRIKT